MQSRERTNLIEELKGRPRPFQANRRWGELRSGLLPPFENREGWEVDSSNGSHIPLKPTPGLSGTLDRFTAFASSRSSCEGWRR